MPSAESIDRRMAWRPGQPRTWAIESAPVAVDASVEHLIVVSDLHAYREPLDAIDVYLRDRREAYAVFVNGDLFEGGIDAAATVEWVRSHAQGRVTRGNHDSLVFAYLAGRTAEYPAALRAPDAELGAYKTLNDEQNRFIAELPDELLVSWRGKRIRMLHGHQNHHDDRYTPWTAAPDLLMELFFNAGVDLTMIGHTHYPFVRRRGGSCLANSGSVSAPIHKFVGPDGKVHDRIAADGAPISPGQPNLLSITERNGQLEVQIVPFDYDRRGMLDRYARQDNLRMAFPHREHWIMNGQFGLPAKAD